MKDKKQAILVSVAIVLTLAGAGWAFGLFGSPVDPAVAELERQRDQVFSEDATDEDRQAFRDQVRSLTDDQRRQLFERGRPDIQERISARMNELYALPPEEFQREVMQRVDDLVAARAERDSDGEGPRGGFGPPAGMTDAQRDQRRKERLDFVDSETRAQFSEFRRAIDAELEARGEPPMQGRDFRTLMRGGRG